MAVCHAGVIMASMRLLLDLPPGSTTRLRPSNTGLTVWEHDPEVGSWSLHTFNDAAHLPGVVA